MKFGIQHENYRNDGEGKDIYQNVELLARFADKNGIDSFWLPDHFMQLPDAGDPMDPVMEPWVLLSAISRETESIKLGVLVNDVFYRHPSVLAKMGATLDLISKGRLFFGIGAGWYEAEARSYGLQFAPPLERLRTLEESVKIVKGLWTEKRFTFHGAHFDLNDAPFEPKPLQVPHPPVLIGGSGDLTLSIVAREGDACNLFGGTVDKVKSKLALLRNLSQKYGRDYNQITKSILLRLMIIEDGKQLNAYGIGNVHIEHAIYGTIKEVKDKIRAYANVGINYMIFNFYPTTEWKNLELLADIIPDLAD